MDSQCQALDKGRQMGAILKGTLDQKQNSHASWLATTIKNIIKKPVKELCIPVLSFKRTHKSALQKRNILADFYGNLCDALKEQKGSPLDYGSELLNITRINKLFSHHEDKDRIVDIIPKG